jgi:hypothetical protein
VACVAALAACGSGSGGGSGVGAGQSAAQEFAHCMRSHGVTNFPDPLSRGGFPDPVTRSQVPPNTNVLVEGSLMFPLGSTIDPGSPAFHQADAACGGHPGGQPKGG